MATAVIYPRSDKKGITSVKINIRHKYEKKQIHIFNIESKLWDSSKLRVKPSHPEHNKLNFELYSRLNQYTKRIEELRFNEFYTLSDILDNKPQLISQAIDLYSQPLSYQNKRKYQNLKDKIIAYRDTYITSVDLNYIKGFIQHLKNSESINSQVTIHRYLNFLKTCLRSHENLIDKRILDYKIPKGKASKPKLTREEIHMIEKSEICEISRDAFLMCFYSWGSRIGDILQLRYENISENSIIFREQKTGKIKKVEINDQIKSIITRYKNQSFHSYLLPILEKPWRDPKSDYNFNKHIQVKTAMINRDLKLIAATSGIKKKLTTHVARHSFASLADRSDINSRAIRDMMNFSSLNIMENYLEDLRRTDYLKEQAKKIY